MTNLTFSNKSNAVRGFRQAFPELAARHDNEFVRSEFIGSTDKGVVIELETVAAAQCDVLGEVAGSTLAGVAVLRRSVSASRPVGRAHRVYSALPAGTTRRDAIAAAVAQGIAYFTARTQYQAWTKLAA